MIFIDIPMPDNCYKCPIRYRHYCNAKQRVLDNNVTIINGKPISPPKRPEWCPLKMIEEVYHGDLSDSN